MSVAEVMEVENLEFKWGKKRGRGGKKMDVQFYESFTYDGVEYALYDSVYLYKEGEPYPYLGKLIKIWENADKSKKVKVLWYFRPEEISNYLLAELTHPNEVFMACGEGVGLANVNSLEAIGGKCNLACISKDSRNPQPSDEQLQMADFVFSRFFDVGHCIILDEIGEKIAGIDVKFIFNQEGSLKPSSVSDPSLDAWMSLPKPESSGNQIPDDKLEEQKTVVGKKLDANGRRETVAICEAASSLKVQEDSDLKEFSVEPNLSPGEKHFSAVGAESDKLNKTNGRLENTSAGKIGEAGGSSVNPLKVDEKLKSTKNGEIDERPHKKAKVDSSVKVSNDSRNNINKPNCNADSTNSKPLVPKHSSSEDKTRPASGPLGTAKNSSNKLKVDNKMKKPVNGKLSKESPNLLPRDGIKNEDKTSTITSRPDSDRSKWFAELPWEERMQDAHERGRLVLFQNLDLAYTSAEVEDVVWEVFKETCKVKMVHKTACSSPHSGQAFVIFKTSEVAEQVFRKLDEGCLLLPNGRPLVAGIANPCFPKKQSTFAGHLILDKLKPNREMKEAVSTSHSSQPNTLEYDMAMEWCLLVEKSDRLWRRLYKQHGEELVKLKANLKSK